MGVAAGSDGAAGPRPGAPHKGSVVLIVEDDEDTAAVMAQCLGDAGYRTLSAPDGQQALTVAEGQRVALVLLDWRLPGPLWGRPLLQKLRAHYGVPVVVISADQASLSEASAAGASDYLPKPFQLADLVHVVDDHCH